MQKPRLIVIANRKGGVGKTTTTGHLAVQAGLAGDGPVALIDTDPQGSLVDWWNQREAPEPLFAMIDGDDLGKTIEVLASGGTSYVIIDTPPLASDEISKVVAFADLVVIPIRPSPHDLRAVGQTLDIVKGAGKPFVFVITQAKQQALLTLQTMAALSAHGPVSTVIIHDRVDFAGSMVDGRTVLETDPKGRSATEIVELWDDIKKRFDGMMLGRLEENFRSISRTPKDKKDAA